MTLATHVIIAGALTRPLAHIHPAASFAAALASHYLSDAIPHWDYALEGINSSNPPNKRLVSLATLLRRDMPRILFDLFLGAAILFLMTAPHTRENIIRFILVTAGGVLPDTMQGIYYVLKHFGYAGWLAPIQRFHDRMHTKIKLGAYPRFGVPFQLIIFFIFLFLLR